MAEKIPLTELIDELTNDPAGMGYKDGEDFKPSKEIIGLFLQGRPVPNPDPQGTVPQPPHVLELMGAVTPAEMGKCPFDMVTRLREMCDGGDLAGLEMTVEYAKAAGIFTVQGSLDSVRALLDRTKPDPDWPDTVTGPSRVNELWPEIGRIYIDQIDQCLGR